MYLYTTECLDTSKFGQTFDEVVLHVYVLCLRINVEEKLYQGKREVNKKNTSTMLWTCIKDTKNVLDKTGNRFLNFRQLYGE
jgi:hypothetical protein